MVEVVLVVVDCDDVVVEAALVVVDCDDVVVEVVFVVVDCADVVVETALVVVVCVEDFAAVVVVATVVTVTSSFSKTMNTPSSMLTEYLPPEGVPIPLRTPSFTVKLYTTPACLLVSSYAPSDSSIVTLLPLEIQTRADPELLIRSASSTPEISPLSKTFPPSLAVRLRVLSGIRNSIAIGAFAGAVVTVVVDSAVVVSDVVV